MKMRSYFVFLLVLFLALPSLFAGEKAIDQETIDSVKTALLEKYGKTQKFRIERGVDQTAALWREEDGCTKAFTDFCLNFFIGTPEALDANLKRLEINFEVLSGHFLKMIQDLNRPVQLEGWETLPIDMIFAQYSPAAHLDEDFFKNKIAFFIRLNFPEYSLAEKTEHGPIWSRKEWAHARTGGMFSSRVPADVIQQYSRFSTEADAYIANYNIFMGKLIDQDKNTYFPQDMKLITHWNLRDELKSQYVGPDGLFKQKMIYEVMLHIVNQTIPEAVINSSEYEWDPLANKIYKDGKEADFSPEPNTRYQRWLNIFKGQQALDPYFPQLPTFIQRKFDAEREIPEADVEALFTEFCSSPQVKEVAKLIQKRLGRKLKPWDIWYNGFRAGSSISEEKLDKMVAERYPTVEAFQKDIENILFKLGFSEEQSEFLADRIQVDPSRGAGHAWGAEMKSEKALLRTRIPEGGMNYKGFSIALHELGHCVEQTFTLHGVDYYMLRGIPNAAFTEAFAYVLQDMDFDVLDIDVKDENIKHLVALENFWNTYEIMGVSLVDMKAWNWLYAHPEATPEQLKEAVVAIAKDVWNTYYADVFGVKDTPLLAIYSHMVFTPLYLPDYAIGHLIYFQIGRYLEGKNLGKEMERMCVAGNIVPQLWMINAVGKEISARALLDAVDEALKHVK